VGIAVVTEPIQIEFVVALTVEREDGPVSGRSELVRLIREELEAADPGSVETDNGGTYEVHGWTVIPVRQA
jgi:hypothetical protein